MSWDIVSSKHEQTCQLQGLSQMPFPYETYLLVNAAT